MAELTRRSFLKGAAASAAIPFLSPKVVEAVAKHLDVLDPDEIEWTYQVHDYGYRATVGAKYGDRRFGVTVPLMGEHAGTAFSPGRAEEIILNRLQEIVAEHGTDTKRWPA